MKVELTLFRIAMSSAPISSPSSCAPVASDSFSGLSGSILSCWVKATTRPAWAKRGKKLDEVCVTVGIVHPTCLATTVSEFMHALLYVDQQKSGFVSELVNHVRASSLQGAITG